MEAITLYLVCAWDNYYPHSEDGNIKGIFLTEEEADIFFKKLVNEDTKYDRYEIVRRKTDSLDK